MDNENHLILAFKNINLIKHLVHTGVIINTETQKMILVITNTVNLGQQGHKPNTGFLSAFLCLN